MNTSDKPANLPVSSPELGNSATMQSREQPGDEAISRIGSSVRHIIAIDPDGFYLHEVLSAKIVPPRPGDQELFADYHVKVNPETFATLELAYEAIGRERNK